MLLFRFLSFPFCVDCIAKQGNVEVVDVFPVIFL